MPDVAQFQQRRQTNIIALAGQHAFEGVRYLGASTNIVRVTGDTARNFFSRNLSVTDFEIFCVSFGISYGMMIGEAANTNILMIGYQHQNFRYRHKIAIKMTNNCTEL